MSSFYLKRGKYRQLNCIPSVAYFVKNTQRRAGIRIKKSGKKGTLKTRPANPMRLPAHFAATRRVCITLGTSGASKNLIYRDADGGAHRSNTSVLRGCATKVCALEIGF
jgi:hypothetical protein